MDELVVAMAKLKLDDDPPVFENMEGTVKLIILITLCFGTDIFSNLFKLKVLFFFFLFSRRGD